jgi:peptidoglycan hydrolase CwlO-like protein
MSKTLIERIEVRLRDENGLDAASKQELLDLLDKLRSEVQELESTHADQAESIASFAGAAAHEATRHDTNQQRLQLAIDGVSSAVAEVETEHPRLVEITNAFCTMLSNLGI